MSRATFRGTFASFLCVVWQGLYGVIGEGGPTMSLSGLCLWNLMTCL